MNLLRTATVPPIERMLMFRPARALARIVGSRGPLTEAQSRALLRRAGIDDDRLDALQRHLAIEQAVADAPLVAGNQTRVLRDGENTFRAMFTAIRNATNHINLEYYILEDIESDGVMLSDLLVEKARTGVAVNIIYDSFGSVSTPDEFFEKLRAAGIKLLAFNPLNPLKAKNGYKPNDRDHRKILIADGRLGIVGGINLSKTYISSGPRAVGKSGGGGGGQTPKPWTKLEDHAAAQPARADAEEVEYWRDIDLEIVGPAVVQLQKLFLEQWHDQQGPELNQGNFFPPIAPLDGEVVRIIGSTPAHPIPRYYVTLVSAIRNADRSVYLTNAYFAPTFQERRALRRAAKRGVDVRLLLPGKSDAQLVVALQRSHYGPLLRAGVKIYEVHDHILHTKAVVIDGVWTAIGSSNVDHRSILYNAEVDAVVLGKQTAGEMERLFMDDIAAAREIRYAEWRRRPWIDRLVEAFARIFEPLL